VVDAAVKIKNNMEHKCDICNKKMNSQGSLEQHKTMAHPIVKDFKAKINFKKTFSIILLILIVGLVLATSYVKSSQPGESDSFAKCLTDKGVVVFGNDYCTYTAQNLNFFGKSKQYLNYIKCIDNEELCNSKGIITTPTWEINGETYSGVLNFNKLSELSGCEL